MPCLVKIFYISNVKLFYFYFFIETIEIKLYIILQVRQKQVHNLLYDVLKNSNILRSVHQFIAKKILNYYYNISI